MVYVPTFLFGFARGGSSMADFERLNDEPGLKRFLGIERFPDETSLAERMRSIGESGAEALMRINRDFIEWATGRIVPGTLLQGGELEWFLASGHLGQGSRDCSELLPSNSGNARACSASIRVIFMRIADRALASI